jgi:hypothetical protein
MQTYRVEIIVSKDHKLVIGGLPLRKGEKVEVIILSQSHKAPTYDRYSLRGQPYRYNLPFESIADDDWNAIK